MKISNYSNEHKQAVLALFDLNTPVYFSIEEKEGLIDFLDNEIEFYYVLEHNGKVLASGGYNFLEDQQTVRLSWDMVHPDFHRKGLGKALLQFRIKEILETHQTKRIQVRTSQFTFLFYQKNGFELKQVVPDYWAKGFDLYDMFYKNIPTY